MPLWAPGSSPQGRFPTQAGTVQGYYVRWMHEGRERQRETGGRYALSSWQQSRHNKKAPPGWLKKAGVDTQVREEGLSCLLRRRRCPGCGYPRVSTRQDFLSRNRLDKIPGRLQRKKKWEGACMERFQEDKSTGMLCSWRQPF